MTKVWTILLVLDTFTICHPLNSFALCCGDRIMSLFNLVYSVFKEK
jgi:hypothetical protein